MKTEPKFKVGDWLTAEGKIHNHIVGYIQGEEHIYAVEVPNKDRNLPYSTFMTWMTEFELLDRDKDMVKVPAPDFARFAKLEAGDSLRVGGSTGDEPEYVYILARAGDVVLLSSMPHKHELEKVSKVSEQIKELTDGDIDPMKDFLEEGEEEMMRKHSSSRYAKRVATVWKTTDWLAWMNWKIVEE